MNRIRVQEMPCTERSKALAPRRRAEAPYAEANRVAPPVAVTTAVPLPEATLLPWKQSSGRPNGPSERAVRTWLVVPVRGVDRTLRHRCRLPAQGGLVHRQPVGAQQPYVGWNEVTGPEPDHIPGHQLVDGQLAGVRGGVRAGAAQGTVAVVATSSRSAAAARSARCSWAERGRQLTTTRTRVTQAVAQAFTAAETSPGQSSTEVKGSRKLRVKRRGQETGRQAGGVFSPHRASRSCA